jgi:mannose-1-phosphate guanylyltransferase / mannose-6-phosphate isomerase
MLVPVILSGGSGSRLWPVSRELHPKPFMKIDGDISLIQKTFMRVADIIIPQLHPVTDILTITNQAHYFLTKDEYQNFNVGHNEYAHIKKHFLLEPCAKNTAAAIVNGALFLKEHIDADAIMLVVPADHIIENTQAFNHAVEHAYALAQQNYLVTFGIEASEANTGYGYIQQGDIIDNSNAYRVKRFCEKPNAQTAEEFIQSGEYYWNGGIFVFKVSNLLAAMLKYNAELYEKIADSYVKTQYDKYKNIAYLDIDSFNTLPDISIDYALMEKADNIAVLPTDIQWLDVGSWSAMGSLSETDAHGNASEGDSILINVNNCYVKGHNRLVAMVGVDNLIVIDTADALLISDKNQSQDVKKIVDKLKLDKNEIYKIHKTANRPWGTYTVLEEGQNFKIKRIVVKPKQSLSLQMHHHRSEHWVVVSGVAKVTNGDQEIFLNTNESTFIPAGHKHRLENPGVLDLVMIEVQSGQYLGEDDIVRFSDNYGRI